MKMLSMPPYNTTLMGVVRGVADHFGIRVSTPTLYGFSGHAFLINVHKELCPSGPYCWKLAPFQALLENAGIRMTHLGSFSAESGTDERAAIEKQLIQLMDSGAPCSMLSMENQLITGKDETCFYTAKPWPSNPDFPPPQLTFGSWNELGEEYYVSFFSFSKVGAAAPKDALRACLDYAIDLSHNSRSHSEEGYGIGPDAYDHWQHAIAAGAGSSHGNWWNAMVWSECRREAGAFFKEMASAYPIVPGLAELANLCSSISSGLEQAGDRELPDAEKSSLLEKIAEMERELVTGIGQVRASL